MNALRPDECLCPDCGGRGYVTLYEHRPQWDDPDFEVGFEEVCPMCGGNCTVPWAQIEPPDCWDDFDDPGYALALDASYQNTPLTQGKAA